MLKNAVRRWLGLDRLNMIEYRLTNIETDMGNLKDDLVLPIAKLTAILEDESSEARQRASDKLGMQAINRMRAEAKARDLTTDGNG